jgi:hypothetical protein
MFSLFKSPVTQQDLQKRAKEAYERVVNLTADTPEARKMRRGMALLCCVHLDKTFIAGAQRTAEWQQMAAFAATQGKEAPPLPKADCFQKVRSGMEDIWVYLPPEYAERAFAYGSKYQRTELGMEAAINTMQQLADQIFRFDMGLNRSLLALKFLRQELSLLTNQDGGERPENPDEVSAKPPLDANANPNAGGVNRS